MGNGYAEREKAAEELAARLFFRMERHGERYSLCRDVDVREPVRREGLTLDEAEVLLDTWKMQGAHGG
jgi:hypothetical protein